MDGLHGPRLTCACMLSALLREAFHHADSSSITCLAGAPRQGRLPAAMARRGPATWLWLAPWETASHGARGGGFRLCLCHVPNSGGAGGMGTAPPGAKLVPAMPEGMEDTLTAGSTAGPGRRERPNCCTCPLGDILPTRGPVTVTERVRSWAAQSPGDG